MHDLATILLVEDNLNDIELFRIFLMEEAGIQMQLQVAGSGEEAIAHLRERRNFLPDAVFLDVNMPRMDGFEVLQEIRMQLRLKELPVCMLSTSDDEWDIEFALNNGADHYMCKPANPQRLQQFVTKTPGLHWHEHESGIALRRQALILPDSVEQPVRKEER